LIPEKFIQDNVTAQLSLSHGHFRESSAVAKKNRNKLQRFVRDCVQMINYLPLHFDVTWSIIAFVDIILP